jgi:cell division protein FtsN
VATRKSPSNARRDEPKSQQRKGGSLMTGLFIGLVIGLVVAAGLAWYFNIRTPAFKSAEENAPQLKADKPSLASPAPATGTSTAEAASSANDTPVAAAQVTPNSAPSAAPDVTPSPAKPRVDYTFYGILPGEKPAKQTLPPPIPPQSKEIWWLQVAALKSPADADKLKARLTLLGLQVAMQKVDNGGSALYRIRTGPYKREDDALGDLDTLAASNFEPRLFKEPNPLAAAPKTQEKP